MEKSMHTPSGHSESGATFLEVLIASAVFIIVLALSLGAATEFSEYGNQADADAGTQLDSHRAFSKMERILRQGWSTPIVDAEGTSVTIQVLGYFFNTGTDSWEQIDPATWQRQYDTSTASYYFVDSFGNSLPVADCQVSWNRLSSDPNSELYHFGDLTCTLTFGAHTTEWVLANKIGTHETDAFGQRMNGMDFSVSGKSIEVELRLQRESDDLPYSIRSRIQQRNFLESI
jgi:hypothetical protein